MIRSLAESKADAGECRVLSFDEVRELIDEESEGGLELGGESEMDHDEVDGILIWSLQPDGRTLQLQLGATSTNLRRRDRPDQDDSGIMPVWPVKSLRGLGLHVVLNDIEP